MATTPVRLQPKFAAVPKVELRAPAGRPVETPALQPNRFDAAPRTRDGLQFLTRKLDEIRARVAAGETVRVVFDIDDTLVDTRSRTLAIARRFDEQNGTNHFSTLSLKAIGYDIDQTVRALNLPWPVEQQFTAFWREEFFQGRNYQHDAPVPAMLQLAKDAKAAGAEITYLTGRADSMEPFTLEQLERLGFPDVSARRVVSKPSRELPTGVYKAQQLDEWRSQGVQIGFFMTESHRDIAAIQKLQPWVDCVRLDSPLIDGGGTRLDTPVYPRAL